MINIRIKKAYLFLAFLGILLSHISFAFAKFNGFEYIEKKGYTESNNSKKFKRLPSTKRTVLSNNIYESLQLQRMGLNRQVFNYALKGFNYMSRMGLLKNDRILSIVDYSKPSSEKRLYIIDLQKVQVLYKTYVSHGAKSGKEFAHQFSNSISSNKSSLGFYETEKTYIGKNGYSLQLNGLEKGINDHANEQAIVIHGAPYVSESFIKMKGLLGRSWGCPAIPENVSKPIIDKIKNGTCLFIYANDKRYLKKSTVLNS
jgi:hypothetical protein